jgi:hypothetical protein
MMPGIHKLLTPGDLDIGWRTVRMESAGESYAGKVAVAHVLINRVNYRQGDRWNTLAQVCLDWLQFSGWREADPTFKAALYADLDLVGIECVRALAEACTTADTTQGARHYHARSVSPSWAAGKVPVLDLGAHRFYAGIA